MDEIGIEQARQQLGEIVDRARLAGKPTRITRSGKPAVIVVSVEWHNRTRAALAAFREAGWDGSDPPVSAREVRNHALQLWGLISNARKYMWSQQPEVAELLTDLDAEVGKLADLLPENVEEQP